MSQTPDDELTALRAELELTRATLEEYRLAAADRSREVSSLVQQIATASDVRPGDPTRSFVFRQKRRTLKVADAVKRRLVRPYQFALRIRRGVKRRIANRARAS